MWRRKQMKTNEIKVLDHGYVKLIDHMGTDEDIISAARMSTGRGFEGWDDREQCEQCGEVKGLPHRMSCADLPHAWKKKPGDKGLLDFMYRNKHSTPFEMCELQIEVQAPIMVFREWHRHRTQSYSEFSARYSVMPNLHYVPDVGRIQKQSKTNKQGSDEAFTEAMAVAYRDELEREQHDVYSTYDNLIQAGVAKEVARLNTPVSRYSKMRAKTDLRNWLGFLNLRMRPNAQLEIRLYAEAVAAIVRDLWPRTYALFEEYDLYGVHLSRTEMKALLDTMHDDGDLEWAEKNLMRNAKNAGMSDSKQTELLRKYKVGGKEIL
jgi:thymidylate synthase (FAD)